MVAEHRHPRIPGKIDSSALPHLTELSTCVGWYDVSYETGWVDGDASNLWTDRVARNGNAVAAGANRPTYKTNIINGLPVFRYVNNYMTLEGTFSYPHATWFIVMSRAATANNDFIFGAHGTAYSYLQYGGTWYSASGISAAVAFPQGSFKLKCVKYDGANHTYYTNGAQDAIVGTAAEMVYRHLGAAGYTLSADIAEIILYSSALSDVKRGIVETYINAKYALW